MTTTDRLNAWVRDQGLKQVDLARRLAVSEATVSLIMNGHRDPAKSFAARFVATFGAESAAAIFGDAQALEPHPNPDPTP
jgi:transcriptional regulator with XRE-family HTH domain